MKKKILIISQYFYPNNFRINDIVSKLPEKKYTIEILSSNLNYISKKKNNIKKYKKLKFPNKKFFTIHRLPVISRNGSSFFGIASEYVSFVLSGIIYGKKK